MVSINLFGKKWDFDNDTMKYIGCGLAVFYVLRIIKFVIQRTMTGKVTFSAQKVTLVKLCLFCFDLSFQISNPVIEYRPDPSCISYMEACAEMP